MSEEAETFLPGRRSMHIGVFGSLNPIIAIQRPGITRTASRTSKSSILSALNHLPRYRPGWTWRASDPLVRRSASRRAIERSPPANAACARPTAAVRVCAPAAQRPAERCTRSRRWADVDRGEATTGTVPVASRGRSSAVARTRLPLARDVYAIIFSATRSSVNTRALLDSIGELVPGAFPRRTADPPDRASAAARAEPVRSGRPAAHRISVARASSRSRSRSRKPKSRPDRADRRGSVPSAWVPARKTRPSPPSPADCR